MVRAHRLRGLGVLLRRWPLPKERLQGITVPKGAGPPAAGTGSRYQAVLADQGAPTGE